MALTPLQIEIIDTSGAAVAGAPLEVRHELTGVTASYYNRDGTVATGVVTDSDGAAQVWLPNGIYEWRTTSPFLTAWKAFRANSGFGAESAPIETGPLSVSMDDPLSTFPTFTTLTTLVVPSFGVEDVIGTFKVTVDFVFSHLWDLVLIVAPPGSGGGGGGGGVDLWSAGTWAGSAFPAATSADDYAFDGTFTIAAQGSAAQYADPDLGTSVQMVDGTTYVNSGVAESRGDVAGGNWVFSFAEIHSDFPSDHFGEFRGASIEFIPD